MRLGEDPRKLRKFNENPTQLSANKKNSSHQSLFNANLVQYNGKSYTKQNDTIFNGNCGVQALGSALRLLEIKKLDDLRKEIVDITANYFYIHDYNPNAMNDHDAVLELAKAYKASHGNNFAFFKEHVLGYMYSTLNSEGINKNAKAAIKTQIQNLERLIISFDNIDDILWKDIHKYCGTFTVNITSLLKDHAVGNGSDYIGKVNRNGVWLTNSEINAYMVANNYKLVENTENANGALLVFKNTNNNILYIYNKTENNQALLFDMQTRGVHWIHLVPMPEEVPTNNLAQQQPVKAQINSTQLNRLYALTSDINNKLKEISPDNDKKLDNNFFTSIYTKRGVTERFVNRIKALSESEKFINDLITISKHFTFKSISSMLSGAGANIGKAITELANGAKQLTDLGFDPKSISSMLSGAGANIGKAITELANGTKQLTGLGFDPKSISSMLSGAGANIGKAITELVNGAKQLTGLGFDPKSISSMLSGAGANIGKAILFLKEHIEKMREIDINKLLNEYKNNHQSKLYLCILLKLLNRADKLPENIRLSMDQIELSASVGEYLNFNTPDTSEDSWLRTATFSGK